MFPLTAVVLALVLEVLRKFNTMAYVLIKPTKLH